MTQPVTPPCSFCGGPNDRLPQRYCSGCHRDYQREWRAIQKQKQAELARQVDQIRQVLTS